MACALALLAPAQGLADGFKVSFKVTAVMPSVYRQPFSRSEARWGNEVLLQQGIRLNPDDRLISRGRGYAMILCSGVLNRFTKRDYIQVSSFCQSQRAAPIQAIPGGQDPALPYLLEPRISLVRGPSPTVRWNPVPGVRRYQLWLVRLRDQRLLWGTQVVDASRITLPAQLNLLPGESYRLVVEADNGTSSRLEPLSDGLRFGVLPAAEAQQLEADLAEIRSLAAAGGGSSNVVLLEAGALEQRGLVAEAFARLEQQESRSPSLEGQLQLGRLASLQGLNQQAQAFFRRAAALAREAGDGEAGREAREGEQLALRLAAACGPGGTGGTGGNRWSPAPYSIPTTP